MQIGKWTRLLQLCIVACGVRLTCADLLIFSHQNVFRYDESGVLLSKMPRNYNVESIDSVAMGLDGTIYGLGNVLGSMSVLRFDRITGAFKDVLIPDNGGISIPRMLAIGPNGNIYVSVHEYVGAMNPTNQYIRVIEFDGASGTLKKTLISAEDGVRGAGSITVGPDGRLYLADSRGIVRYDTSTGDFVDVFSPARPELAVAQTIFFGKNRSLYVVGYDSVYRIDGTTGEVSGKLIAADAQLSPTAAAGPDGDIYLRVGYARDIRRFDGATGASKGVFVHDIGSTPYDDAISAAIFFGPRLSINANASDPVHVKWDRAFQDFVVEESDGIGSLWENISGSAVTVGNELRLDISRDSKNRFFRLVKR